MHQHSKIAQLLLLVVVCALFTFGADSNSAPSPKRGQLVEASWYGKAFHGRTMANGERFDMFNPSIAAHRSLPFGTKLRVTNIENGLTLMVIVKDRGPFYGERSLDLSFAGARELGFVGAGTASVLAEIVL